MAKKTTAKITEIVIELADGKKLKMSPEAAKELRDALEDVLGGRHYITWYYPYYQPSWAISTGTTYGNSSGKSIYLTDNTNTVVLEN